MTSVIENAEALRVAVSLGDLDRIENLVKSHGVDVNLDIKGFQNPLFTAESCGRIRSLRLLIELGANVDAVNDLQITTLMCASSYSRWQMVDILLRSGANPNFFRSSDNATALKFSANTKNGYKCAQLLLSAGADPNFPKMIDNRRS